MALLPLLAPTVLSISGTRIVNRDSRPCRGAISQFLAVHSNIMAWHDIFFTDNEVKAKPRLEQSAANDIRKLQTEEHSGEGKEKKIQRKFQFEKRKKKSCR